jgi:hypothetical protein
MVGDAHVEKGVVHGGGGSWNSYRISYLG